MAVSLTNETVKKNAYLLLVTSPKVYIPLLSHKTPISDWVSTTKAIGHPLIAIFVKTDFIVNGANGEKKD